MVWGIDPIDILAVGGSAGGTVWGTDPTDAPAMGRPRGAVSRGAQSDAGRALQLPALCRSQCSAGAPSAFLCWLDFVDELVLSAQPVCPPRPPPTPPGPPIGAAPPRGSPHTHPTAPGRRRRCGRGGEVLCWRPPTAAAADVSAPTSRGRGGPCWVWGRDDGVPPPNCAHSQHPLPAP